MEGRAAVHFGDGWGYIDTDGNVVIRGRFDDAFDFEDGRAIVRTHGQFGCVDRDGTWILEPRFDFVSCFSEGLCGRGERRSVPSMPQGWTATIFDEPKFEIHVHE